MKLSSEEKKLIRSGLDVSQKDIYDENEIWMRYSSDKVDIGEQLSRVLRILSKALPLRKRLRALSIGSGSEPQFRTLEGAFRGGLYLLDTDRPALDVVRERVRRQSIKGVIAIKQDYNNVLLNAGATSRFVQMKLGGQRVDLIALYHSLYYCPEEGWGRIFENLYRYILARKGVIHAVLMASKSNNHYTTTWLYNHFAGKFFGVRNNQDLRAFRMELQRRPVFGRALIDCRTNRVHFWVNDFKKFMAVVWMILLYPEVHRYSREQRREITEFIYRTFWLQRKPLVQMQDHLVVETVSGLG